MSWSYHTPKNIRLGFNPDSGEFSITIGTKLSHGLTAEFALADAKHDVPAEPQSKERPDLLGTIRYDAG